MTGAEHGSQLRAGFVGAVAVTSLAIGLPLFGLGIVLLAAGVLSWLHPVAVASAWARTLAGLGLIGGGTCLTALGWLGTGWRIRRRLKFIAAIGLLLALICLPFGVAIHAAAHGTWLGWGR
jgi:hypothetical protein